MLNKAKNGSHSVGCDQLEHLSIFHQRMRGNESPFLWRTRWWREFLAVLDLLSYHRTSCWWHVHADQETDPDYLWHALLWMLDDGLVDAANLYRYWAIQLCSIQRNYFHHFVVQWLCLQHKQSRRHSFNHCLWSLLISGLHHHGCHAACVQARSCSQRVRWERHSGVLVWRCWFLKFCCATNVICYRFCWKVWYWRRRRRRGNHTSTRHKRITPVVPVRMQKPSLTYICYLLPW